MADATPAFHQWVALYRHDPVRFVREVLGVKTIYGWQEEVLRAYVAGEKYMSVVSGHRVGKTTCLSWIIIHHVLFNYPQKTVVTAATEGQLFRALVPEVKRWVAKLPEPVRDTLVVQTETIKMKATDRRPSAPDESFVTFTASSEKNPEALAGAHSEGSALVIADEASGVDDVVLQAADGSMAAPNARMILTGNPVRRIGFFFNTQHSLRKTPGNPNGIWRCWHVSSKGNPNVDQTWVAAKAAEYGESSNAYRVRVLGEFPVSEDDSIIPYEAVLAAMQREVHEMSGIREVWGLDVAYSGDDRTVLVKRRGAVVREKPITWWKLEPMQIAGRVKDEWDRLSEKDRPKAIYIDTIIWGMGVYSRLRELGLPVVSVNVSEQPALRSSKYKNLRTELWWRAREWFMARTCSLPEDAEWCEELSAQTYKITESNGTVLAIEKKLIKKELGRSPDAADALILTFCDQSGILGGAQHRDANKEIRRKLKSVV